MRSRSGPLVFNVRDCAPSDSADDPPHLYLTADPAQDVSWNEQGIINRHLTQPEPYDRRGDDAAWERLLRDAHVSEAILSREG